MGCRATIALGSNMGDRVANIESAIRLMKENDLRVLNQSFLYETQAMYHKNQARFLNGACEVSTTKEPLALLDTLQSIEKALGRERTFEKGPRIIDLDIILYGGEQILNDRLTIPHPGLAERDFVLRPVNDIIPNERVPPSGASVSNLFRRLTARDRSMSPVTQLSPNLPLVLSTDPVRTTRIMAILNLTPDSFSDGGIHDSNNLNALTATIRQFVADGATIIDVGGQSTRPGAEQIPASEELKRIIPAIRLIRSMPECRSVAISVDTFEAHVAKEAISAGADIINDISGGVLSGSKLLSVVADAGKTIVLMHMRGDPTTMTEKAYYRRGVIHSVADELNERIEAALTAGIPRWRIILDPGIGFSKRQHHNLTVLRHLAQLRGVASLAGYPWLVGTSRKGFIGKITGVQNPADRIMGTAATVSAIIAGGGDIVRVHDVAEMSQVAKMSDAIYRRKAFGWNEPGIVQLDLQESDTA